MIFLLLLIPCSGIKIAFGSCAGYKNSKNSELWHSIAKWEPDTFIWLGDAIYPKKVDFPDIFDSSTRVTWESLYLTLKNDPGYSQLLRTSKIYGTWDDHDFGSNDDEYFKYKRATQDLFLSFIGEDPKSSRWDQEGIYASYVFEENNKFLKVILLDDRTFNDKESSYWGEEQWEWLEHELKEEADAYLIMNGVQFFGSDTVIEITERVYKSELSRLLHILKDKKGVILASGDVHYSELSLIHI